jgi:hypothetical protein
MIRSSLYLLFLMVRLEGGRSLLPFLKMDRLRVNVNRLGGLAAHWSGDVHVTIVLVPLTRSTPHFSSRRTKVLRTQALSGYRARVSAARLLQA